jgi:poly-gamma-glutamate synthesis protein (capsule biosynthesis protein)
MRIAFVGDICLHTDPSVWAGAGTPDLHTVLGVDLVVGNFESVIDGPKNGAPADKICLTIPEQSLEKLHAIGIDVVSVANNHFADYGAAAAKHTVEALQKAFGRDRVFGWRDQPTVTLAPGLQVVGVCFPETNPIVLEGPCGLSFAGSVKGLVGQHRSGDSELIVFAHWGEEHVACTAPELRARARTLLEEGAAHVVASHSHVVGAGEDIGRGSAIYSLGNFVFRTIPEGNRRMLPGNCRGAVAVYSWDGERLMLEESWRSAFDERLNLSARRGRRRLPGGRMAKLHLRLPQSLQGTVYRSAVRTRWFRRGIAKIARGIERPSVSKLGTVVKRHRNRGGAPSGGR